MNTNAVHGCTSNPCHICLPAPSCPACGRGYWPTYPVYPSYPMFPVYPAPYYPYVPGPFYWGGGYTGVYGQSTSDLSSVGNGL